MMYEDWTYDPDAAAMSMTTGLPAAAALTVPATVSAAFTRPIIVNPGEFVAVVKKKVGTAPSAGVVAHTVTFNAGWI